MQQDCPPVACFSLPCIAKLAANLLIAFFADESPLLECDRGVSQPETHRLI